MLFETTVSWPGAIWTQLNCLLVSNNTDAYRKGLWRLNGAFLPRGAAGGCSGHEGDGRFAVTLSTLSWILLLCGCWLLALRGFCWMFSRFFSSPLVLKGLFVYTLMPSAVLLTVPFFFLRFYRKPTGTCILGCWCNICMKVFSASEKSW